MAEGNRITLAELAARDRAKRIAEYEAQRIWEQTPEGAAWRTEQDAHHQRMAEADRRYALEHPPSEDDEDADNDETVADDE